MAKATTILHGLLVALNIGFSKVILKGDSITIIRHLQTQEEDYLELRPITRDAQNLVCQFTSYRFEFKAREGNVTTYALASEAMQYTEDKFWVENAPQRVLELIDLD